MRKGTEIGETMRYASKEIEKMTAEITRNSELFGDECDAVAHDLSVLSQSANELGCEITDTIPDWWGGSVIVTAVPDTYRHEWTF